MEDPALRAVALALVPGLGARRWRELVARFGDARAVLGAGRGALEETRLVGPRLAERIARADLEPAARLVARVADAGGTVLVPRGEHYPPLLAEIPDPPPMLFALGRLDLLHAPSVSMVGSRNHTTYGATVARMLAGGLARAGLVVASGMARGIDAIAHEGALDAGGGSIGVLGNGFGVIYPAANRALYARMAREGCLLTEFPPGERPQAGAFQARNRLVSGLSLALVVVEGGRQSGTAITARHAADQGRTVLAVPGPITSPTSWGTNRLLRDGARPALDAESVLEEYGMTPPAQGGARLDPPSNLPAEEAAVLAVLGADATHVDRVCDAVARPVSEVLAALSALELRGLARHEPGQRFARG